MSCCAPKTEIQPKQSCCGPASGSSATDSVLDNVKEYYGKTLNTTSDLKTSACTTSCAPDPILRDIISQIPTPVLEKYYGCGSPLPTGGLTGLTVLDLGSGSGRDCYICAKLVGETGKVYGIDMTDEQLSVARDNAEEYCVKKLGYDKSNLEFKKGYIEDIEGTGIVNESVDLVISNCVINLSPDKEKVIQGVFDSLKYGGEFYFSDVYCDRRLPEEVRQNKVLWGECISGALYVEDFKRICTKVGFVDVRQLAISPVEVEDPELKKVVGNARFFSVTYRCFKLKDLETLCEDYGQVAKYKGTIEGNEHSYTLDEEHVFETNKPMLVCGNTASMVGDSWLAKHFDIMGDRSVHYGIFADCYQPNVEEKLSIGGGGCC
eukprot:augustus_masked-scaffold_34-processed-gene-1.16-mRNA-1 protein AED:0.07 eAED:0.07 QI:0/-1/0/1/-1/1/1/0/376